jgi:hypothetical protein
MPQNRRRFFMTAAGASALMLPSAAEAATDPDINVFGPRPGYSPQIGTLVSEMIWMRRATLAPVRNLTPEQLDFLLDDKANRIGALLLHLAATDVLYHLNTFAGMSMPQIGKAPEFRDFAVAMDLGEPARKAIRGHDLDYYLGILHDTREKTLAEFRKRDDAWLLSVDKTWGWGPTNNLCKWFHVCEHESHHSGQIGLLRSRALAAKSDNG